MKETIFTKLKYYFINKSFENPSSNSQNQNSYLIDSLINAGRIKTQKIAEIMKSVDRKNFVPKNREIYAYADSPQPLGYGATISAPHMHAIALVFLTETQRKYRNICKMD